MPGFETHLEHGTRWASFVAIVGLGPVYLLTYSLPVVALVGGLTFLSGLLGAVVPDLDSYSSIPRRYFEQSLSMLLIAGFSFSFGFYWDPVIALVQRLIWSQANQTMVFGIALLTGIAGLLTTIHILSILVQKIIPVHRDLLHTVYFWALMSICLGGGVVFLSSRFITNVVFATFVGLSIGGALLGGVCVHLWLDDELLPNYP